MEPIITLTTDFGAADAYVAAMKGVILSINPRATIVDITHQVPPQDILHGSYVLSAAYPFFPRGSIHVAVVDPGVGSQRRALAVSSGGHYFVAPDNGVLTQALKGLSAPARAKPGFLETVECPLPPETNAFELANRRYHLPEVSSTFHGRDIFAPVAGHLSEGVALAELGPRVSTLRCLSIPTPLVEEDGLVKGTVLHIDSFGDAVTTIRREHLSTEKVEVRIASHTIRGLSPSYAAGEGPIALWSSAGYLEIAVKNGNAAQTLGLQRGDPIEIGPLRQKGAEKR